MANEARYDEELDTLTDEDQDVSPVADDAYDEHGQPLQEDTVETDWAHPADAPFEEPYGATIAESPQQAPLDPLDQLPMTLTLRCGHLDLTLGELRRIAAGTVLEVSGITPGYATLCHGDRVVAEGELVDVEGRLGLHITRMALPA